MYIYQNTELQKHSYRIDMPLDRENSLFHALGSGAPSCLLITVTTELRAQLPILGLANLLSLMASSLSTEDILTGCDSPSPSAFQNLCRLLKIKLYSNIEITCILYIQQQIHMPTVAVFIMRFI